MFRTVLLVIAILVLALLAGAVLAYGTLPAWGQYSHGLQWIVFARRFEWPLVALVLICCIALLALVISGKRRAWWLLALAPILLLLYENVHGGPMRQYGILETPPFVKTDQVKFLADGDFVVSLTVDNEAMAFPYATLNLNPVVVGAMHNTRFVLLWSPLANRATARQVDPDIKGRDLDIVSMPADATLVYNKRFGQFINAITGQQLSGKDPTGFHTELVCRKVPWAQWKKAHPQGWVMSVPPPRGVPLISEPQTPTLPLPPIATTQPATQPGTAVALVATTQPVAVDETCVGAGPLNFDAGQTRVLMFRNPESGRLQAFDRRVWDGANQEDVFPVFRFKHDPAKPTVLTLVDSDSQTIWSLEGKAAKGPWEKSELRPLAVDDHLYWGVMRVWYPTLLYAHPQPSQDVPLPAPQAPHPPSHRRPHSK